MTRAEKIAAFMRRREEAAARGFHIPMGILACSLRLTPPDEDQGDE